MHTTRLDMSKAIMLFHVLKTYEAHWTANQGDQLEKARILKEMPGFPEPLAVPFYSLMETFAQLLTEQRDYLLDSCGKAAESPSLEDNDFEQELI